MTGFQWFQTGQFAAMTAAALILWSVRSAFKSGRWMTALEERLVRLERSTYVVDRLKDIEELLKRAREKQSEMESATTVKIGQIDMALQRLMTEVEMRQEASIAADRRVEMDLEELRRRLENGRIKGKRLSDA